MVEPEAVPPCAECDTPVGIIVELVDPRKEPHDVIAKDVPTLPFQKMFSWKECAIPLVAPMPLREQLMGECTSTEGLDDRDVANALADAMRRTRNRWDEEVQKQTRERSRARRTK